MTSRATRAVNPSPSDARSDPETTRFATSTPSHNAAVSRRKRHTDLTEAVIGATKERSDRHLEEARGRVRDQNFAGMDISSAPNPVDAHNDGQERIVGQMRAYHRRDFLAVHLNGKSHVLELDVLPIRNFVADNHAAVSYVVSEEGEHGAVTVANRGTKPRTKDLATDHGRH